MRKSILAVLILSFLLGVGCTKSIRYSEEEIRVFSPETQDHIRKGEVVLGMTTQEVRYAWGSPDSVRLLEPFEGRPREEWIYSTLGLGVYGTKLLVFFDGKLIYISG
jgi:hypothetical protein